MKREFILEGLNCPNCSAKIQADVEKLPEVSMAVLIKICTALGANIGDIMDLIPEEVQ